MTANNSEEKYIDEILNYLPHRYPFLLIDRVTNLVLGESIKGYKNVTMNEDMFKLVSVVERKGRCYICETACGGKLSIRLRFKNGCGIQFPALQIREES